MSRPSSQAPPWLLPLLLVFLLFSGACALIYQVLWLRLLALTFGVTVHAAATVLASFMGGIALGRPAPASVVFVRTRGSRHRCVRAPLAVRA
ncbi:MAG: hypothetical protein O2917_00605 [Acidobacteria bacterium]|nr:hypothetical protein [Acidobacteriota bacterium]